MLGTFLFAAFFNWTVNGRSPLPLAPAVGILLARRLEQNDLTGRKTCPGGAAICLAAGAALALLVTQADFRLALAVRQSAQQACAKLGREPGPCGFKDTGDSSFTWMRWARAAGHKTFRVKPGDTLVVPENNTSLFPDNSETATLRETFAFTARGWSDDVEHHRRAPVFLRRPKDRCRLPFGPVPPEIVSVYVWKPPLRLPPKN